MSESTEKNQLQIAVEALKSIRQTYLDEGDQSGSMDSVAGRALKEIEDAEPPPEVRYRFKRMGYDVGYLEGAELNGAEIEYQKLEKLIVVVMDPFNKALIPGMQKALRANFGAGVAIISPEPLQFLAAERIDDEPEPK